MTFLLACLVFGMGAFAGGLVVAFLGDIVRAEHLHDLAMSDRDED